jgi:AraC-like DNA-binding protein
VLGNPTSVLTVKDGVARISLTDRESARRAFAHRMYWILAHGLSCWLVGRRIPIRHVDFGCGVPESAADYRLFFGAPVRFSQAESCLTFDETFLHLPIRRSTGALNLFLRNAPSNILVRYRQENDLTAKVRLRLHQQAPAEWPSFEEAARAMRLSSATMRRQLRAEGTSFQAIKDDIRRRHAIDALSLSDSTVGELAVQLGFGEPSAFYRAFRKWTGHSPRSYSQLAKIRSAN